MKNGFFKVAAATPAMHVADCAFNSKELSAVMKEAADKKVDMLVFPELCLTGARCGDLFLQDSLLASAEVGLSSILAQSAGLKMLVFVGLPVKAFGKLYNCAAALFDGQLLGLVPQSNGLLPRNFSPAPERMSEISLCGRRVPFGKDLLFSCPGTAFTAAAELGGDLSGIFPASCYRAAAGATVIAGLHATPERAGGPDARRDLLRAHTARCVCAYVYAIPGTDESTTDSVCSGQDMIVERGRILCENRPYFSEKLLISEVDVDRLAYERRKDPAFPAAGEDHMTVPFAFDIRETELTRFVDPQPFIPKEANARTIRSREILHMQAVGLAHRIQHTGAKCAVVGVSGGLDSTLALLAAARAMDGLGRPRSDILAVTMPCFGTTARTKSNAEIICERVGATLLCIDIKAAVDQHFSDIGHPANAYDVTYENSQARERTQVLMDISNKYGGLVVGTGDLSELALGWATYNGDHMSMYGVNASVPKTLIRHVIQFFADFCKDDVLYAALMDVLATPVSPELLPADNGEIAQKTEDLVGPYELHDFFVHSIVRCAYPPKKVFRLARKAFEGQYDDATILKWLKTFYRRFFNQQFKRSCLPDGPSVGTVTLSPRGGWQMPSDAFSAAWLAELETL